METLLTIADAKALACALAPLSHTPHSIYKATDPTDSDFKTNQRIGSFLTISSPLSWSKLPLTGEIMAPKDTQVLIPGTRARKPSGKRNVADVIKLKGIILNNLGGGAEFSNKCLYEKEAEGDLTQKRGDDAKTEQRKIQSC